ncbi:MAG: short-chain dehydrogenase [Treponema sp. GWB1_62_6]|nr:MAG: short-chain dehydrogenase [Treponema sp. GWC1_61_84]OHE70836.1 MAG: short-chain dehydrogenase [Treponema sp. GWB1_62_6]HCM28707.1 short-chain dehydrogenase [Treponema sp.]
MKTLKSFDLTGRKAFITGGAKGIGRSAALAFAEAGADVAIVDMDTESAETTVKEVKALGVRSVYVKADITDPYDVDRMMEKILAEFKTVDIAFNNAGICVNEKAEVMSYENWKRVIDVNLNGVFLTARAAGRVMIKNRKGCIINTASMSGHVVNVPQPQSAYNASKAGVILLTKSLAVEWAPYNVRVNCISPGYIGTKMTLSATQWIPAWEALTPVKRMGRPEELTAALVYLAGDGASFTTGSDIVIDGAYSCV